ncbi:MAG: patatin-like phospholipase family protein [Acidimicrobiia bacterium]
MGQQPPSGDRPRNAFVLSGGGNLGSIQAGMLKALLASGITPDLLVGTSIGSVNAAFLAADPSPGQVEKLCELWTTARSRDVFTWKPWRIAHALLRQGSLFPAERWRRYLTRWLPYENIEDAAVPLSIMVTDFNDGTPVTLESGSVIDALMASTCLPGIFPPQRIGDGLYLDGVLAEQVPLKPAVDVGAETLYVLASGHASPPPDARSPGQILRHALTILLFPRVRLDALQLGDRHPELRIVQIPTVGAQVALWDMSRHQELIEEAYRETMEFLAGRRPDGSEDAETTTIPEITVEVEGQLA